MAKKKNPLVEKLEPQTPETNHKYYVIVLGASGAGKTVYLASMYNRLMVHDPKIGFYLSTTRQDRRELVARYESLKNHQWPSGTRYSELREWNFTCQVPSSSEEPYSAMEFVYLDYPGEGLTSTPADPLAIEQLDNHINNADALMGIIDGQKIYAALSKKPLSFPTSLGQDLGNILPELQVRSTPVQFIVTKWDLLLNHGYSMRQVTDYLLTIVPFRTYIESCRQKGIPVRIVPVSSVGMKYTQLNENGEMVPLEGGMLEPHYTEMPLACVLFDQIEMRLQKWQEAEDEIRKNQSSFTAKFTLRNLFGKGLGRTVIALHDFLPEKYQWGQVFVQKVSQTFEAPYDRKVKESVEMERKLQAERDASLQDIKNQQTAVTFVLDSMRYLRHQLERDYPESVLSSNSIQPTNLGNV